MKVAIKIIGVVFLFELLFFPLFYHVLWPNVNTLTGNWILFYVRMVSGIGIGLWFASRNRLPAVDANSKKKAVLISAAALLFAAVYAFADLYIPPYDLCWYGVRCMEQYNLFDYPVRLFISENLIDPTTVASYMCLLCAYQLGRLPFSRTAHAVA